MNSKIKTNKIKNDQNRELKSRVNDAVKNTQESLKATDRLLATGKMGELNTSRLQYFAALMEYIATLQNIIYDGLAKLDGDSIEYIAQSAMNIDTDDLFMANIEQMAAELDGMIKSVANTEEDESHLCGHLESASQSLARVYQYLASRHDGEPVQPLASHLA